MELRRAALALLGGVALLASGCTGVASQPVVVPTTHPPAGNAAYATGGTVTVAVPYLPRNFNPSTPAGANRVTQMVMEQVWPQAFVLDSVFQPETTGFIDGAEVVGLSPMTVSYQIDPKATWSDGLPITASDFAYNWHEQLRAAPLLASDGVLAGYRDIRSIKGSNHGKTVTVVFRKSYSDWECLFANLIPAHIARRGGWIAAFSGFDPADVISGGPFVVSSLIPGKRLVLTRNHRYWGVPAHVARIVFLVERSDQAALDGLQNGTISVAEVTAGPPVDNAIARGREHGAVLTDVTTPSPVLWQLAFNLDDPVVGNPDIRRALALATDRVELAADSVNFSDPLNIGASSRVFGEGQPGAAAELFSGPRYNPLAAARLFRSLGYVPDAAGDLRTYAFSAPLTLTLTGPSGDAVVHALELQLQAEWAASGVELVIHNVSTDELLTRVLPEGSYQVALAPYSIPVFPSWNALMYTDPVLPASPPPAGSLDPRGVVSVVTGGGTKADPGVGLAAGGKWLWSMPTRLGTEPGAGADGVVTRDITGLDDPRVARFFQEAMSDLNTTVQAQTLSKLDNLLSHDLPTLPLFQQPVSLVQRADLVNVSESPSWAGPLWDAEDWAIQLPPSAG